VQAFKLAPPATVAPFQYTQMLWAAFYGYLIFGDVPDAFVITGSGLVIASGLYILWREHVRHRQGAAIKSAPK
jgi:drug/metabolite transporter (DMT)-like permease